ncbi:MAG: sulfate/molybdate ABC transporter ATP-binding protein [Rhodospirillales bacterium]|nr:sulfate/molybdate ABC transporter ATP-binding protein [Rhodospirillales bacterium]
MDIEAHHVTKRFNGFVALDDVSLAIRRGELVALLGPSGSGKTTLLRIIAGLEFATSGRILFGGEDASPRGVRERRVGFVFQHYALFRHMTVRENVSFGLRVRPRRARPRPAAIAEKVEELLGLVQMEHLAERYPSQLSGGQRQRVALARALAIEPRILLLDEPFGALDAKVRKELRRWLRRLHDDMGLTSVFVTHDQEEALELADRVVVMDQGRIEQEGPPADVYDRPASPFVYEFLGNVNKVRCVVGEDGNVAVWTGEPGLGGLGVGARTETGDLATAYIRPHDIEIFAGPVRVGQPAQVRHVCAAGPTVRVELAIGDELIEAELSRARHQELDIRLGRTVYIRPRHPRVFAPGEPGAGAEATEAGTAGPSPAAGRDSSAAFG